MQLIRDVADDDIDCVVAEPEVMYMRDHGKRYCTSDKKIKCSTKIDPVYFPEYLSQHLQDDKDGPKSLIQTTMFFMCPSHGKQEKFSCRPIDN